MSRKSFLPATDGSTVTFDFDQGKSWQLTLGGNRTAVFAGGQEGDEVSVMVIQDSTGSRTLSWPSNVSFAGGAPALRTAANATEMFTFVKMGSTWYDKSGAGGGRLPKRVTDAGLTTMIAVGATALTLSLSGGNGQGPGNLPDACQILAQSGSSVLMVCDGSGSLLIGKSGGVAVGVGAPATDRLDSSTSSGYWLPDGTFRTRGAMTVDNTLDVNGNMSGRSIFLNGGAAGKALCRKTTGDIGTCGDTPTNGDCTCS